VSGEAPADTRPVNDFKKPAGSVVILAR